MSIDYDSVAELYDLYVPADYDVPFFLAEVRAVQGPALELSYDRAPFDPVRSPVMIWELEKEAG